MDFITTQTCGRIQRQVDGVRRGWDARSTPAAAAPALWIDVRSLTTTVLAPLFSLQVFDPTRFSPGSTQHSYAFLPFSGGSRWGLCTGGSRCHWLLPAVCDCLHSYVEHEVLFLYVDVLRRRPGSPCTRKPSGPSIMALTSWCPQGLTSFPCQWPIQSIQSFPHFRSMTF